VVQAGRDCGERAWAFPLDDDFAEDLKSDVADVLQCRVATEADHIYAATFLKRFVSPSAPWLHLDLGSAFRPGGLGHVATDFTGSGVRLACAVILNVMNGRNPERS
jgi:leucyl aminopeptidase